MDLLQEDQPPDGYKSGYVAVVGRPNSGKSTLLNALLGEKIAIVSPRPQTTRLRQLGILTGDDYQIVFMDTPGIMRPRHKLDEFMVETAVETITDADVVVWLVDGSEEVGGGDRAIAEQLQTATAPVILALNKADLLKIEHAQARVEAYRALLPAAEWILFSAQKGHGRDELLQMIVRLLPEGPQFYPTDQITDQLVRDMASEFIREQIMLQLREEIPYGTAVRIEEFKERENGGTYISATIFVERDSHKRILIGEKGKQLKAIGSAARAELEQLTETKVFLELWIKVEPKWRQNERSLKRFGYVKQE